MLELKPILLRQLLLWIMKALFSIPVTGVGTKMDSTLLPILGDILMAIARTIVQLPVTPSPFRFTGAAGGVF